MMEYGRIERSLAFLLLQAKKAGYYKSKLATFTENPGSHKLTFLLHHAECSKQVLTHSQQGLYLPHHGW